MINALHLLWIVPVAVCAEYMLCCFAVFGSDDEVD